MADCQAASPALDILHSQDSFSTELTTRIFLSLIYPIICIEASNSIQLWRVTFVTWRNSTGSFTNIRFLWLYLFSGLWNDALYMDAGVNSVLLSLEAITFPSGIVPFPVQVCPEHGANSKTYGTRKLPAEAESFDGGLVRLLYQCFHVQPVRYRHLSMICLQLW